MPDPEEWSDCRLETSRLENPALPPPPARTFAGGPSHFLTVVEIAHVGVVEIGHGLGHGAGGTRPSAAAAAARLPASPAPGLRAYVITQHASAGPQSRHPRGHAQATR